MSHDFIPMIKRFNIFKHSFVHPHVTFSKGEGNMLASFYFVIETYVSYLGCTLATMMWEGLIQSGNFAIASRINFLSSLVFLGIWLNHCRVYTCMGWALDTKGIPIEIEHNWTNHISAMKYRWGVTSFHSRWKWLQTGLSWVHSASPSSDLLAAKASYALSAAAILLSKAWMDLSHREERDGKSTGLVSPYAIHKSNS